MEKNNNSNVSIMSLFHKQKVQFSRIDLNFHFSIFVFSVKNWTAKLYMDLTDFKTYISFVKVAQAGVHSLIFNKLAIR